MSSDSNDSSFVDTAVRYREAGLCVLPAIREQKRPALKEWQPFQRNPPKVDQLRSWFKHEIDALSIVTGEVSGNLEVIDFDQEAELYEAWWEKIPTELRQKLVIETSQSGGKHVIYRCEESIGGNTTLAQRSTEDGLVTLIETRGEGELFLCAPTEGYELDQGDLADLPVITSAEREQLLSAGYELNEHWPEVTNLPSVVSTPSGGHSSGASRPGDNYNARGDIRDLLVKHGWRSQGVRSDGNEHWTRPGKQKGTSATLKNRSFYVFSSNAAPFQPGEAYSPFRVFTMLEHQGDFTAAAQDLRERGFGSSNGSTDDVDISGIMSVSRDSDAGASEGRLEVEDPGPIPDELFAVPGFIDQVIAFTMANAPYPNLALAFCGAIALLSFLTGRKVRTEGDLRTNLYLLALASSGTGKEFPRKVNSHILHTVGLLDALGDRFASGEGIQDAMHRSPAMLFQNDEMDGVLRQITRDRDQRHESIPSILLTLYTTANGIYPLRVRAGQREARYVDQPHLTLFGTATPQQFFESLSQQMLINGFFARMMIVDVGERGEGQTPASASNVPQEILEIAQWWVSHRAESNNLQRFNSDPRIVPFGSGAVDALAELRMMADAQYKLADDRDDEVARTAWSRTWENATKLALIYACSESHESPVISLQAVEWATRFAMHQTRRQLFMASIHVAESPFHAELLRVCRFLKGAGGRMSRSDLLRRMHCSAAELAQFMNTLIQQRTVAAVSVPSATKSAQVYEIVDEVPGQSFPNLSQQSGGFTDQSVETEADLS